MKECRWMTYHLTVHTIIISMSKKTNKLTTMYLTHYRFNVYMTFCTIRDTKMYLKMNIDKHLKFIMTVFRLGISDIAVHYYRYKRHTDKDLICPLWGERERVAKCRAE